MCKSTACRRVIVGSGLDLICPPVHVDADFCFAVHVEIGIGMELLVRETDVVARVRRLTEELWLTSRVELLTAVWQCWFKVGFAVSAGRFNVFITLLVLRLSTNSPPANTVSVSVISADTASRGRIGAGIHTARGAGSKVSPHSTRAPATADKKGNGVLLLIGEAAQEVFRCHGE